MKYASALFGCFSRRQSTKTDAFDTRLKSLTATVRARPVRRRVELPSLFRQNAQATA
ncbi:MAG: hypothetical protein KDE08_00700 [Rhodobacteraceae bacterium]|nr:hypothetical protein [Paracoccaceae bacterium]